MRVVDILHIRIFTVNAYVLFFDLGAIALFSHGDQIHFIAVDSGLAEHDSQVVVVIAHVDNKNVEVLAARLLLEDYLRVAL